MNKIILHIPHSSLKLPLCFWRHTCIHKETVKNFNREICDLYAEKLFGKNNLKKIVAKNSRIFCDVEKFNNDEKEVMSQHGMGVIYTKTNHKTQFLVPTERYRKKILNKYYYPYHKKLTSIIRSELKKHETLILVDCHSYSKDIIMFEERHENLPDICIGFNEVYNKTLIDFATKYFCDLGYNVAQNYPYSGTMVPNGIDENSEAGFNSIMIEIRKDVYLKDEQSFLNLQNQINSLFKELLKLKIH